MKSYSIIKKLNNTELGKSGTHETYILVPQKMDVDQIFSISNKKYSFRQKGTANQYQIRLTVGNEKRIVGLGQFYRDNDLCAGDEVILEVRTHNDENHFYIDFNRNNYLGLKKHGDGFEIIAMASLIGDDFESPILINGQKHHLNIVFLKKIRKRSDSPVMTDIYKVSIDGQDINPEYKQHDTIYIDINNNLSEMKTCSLWSTCSLNWEE